MALTFTKVRSAYTLGAGEKLAAVIALGHGATQGVPHKSKPLEEQARAVFPGLPLGEVRCLPVPEGAVPLPRPEHPVLEVFVNRGKAITKVTANLFFGSGWTSRPTQCKTALLTGPEETQKRLAKLAGTAMKRAAEDLRQRSYHR